MNIYTDEGIRSRRDIDVYIEPNGSLRIDHVDNRRTVREAPQ